VWSEGVGLLSITDRSTSDGRSLMADARLVGKSFDIPKQLVVEAYLKVQANKGAAGVDRQSLRPPEVGPG
jgi:hypothetical protein